MEALVVRGKIQSSAHKPPCFSGFIDQSFFVMKWILLIILITCIVLVAGCTTPTSTTPNATPVTTAGSPAATNPSAPGIPELTGNWSGTSTGYLYQSGYRLFNETIMMMVTSQDGRLFTGVISFPRMNGVVETKAFAGVLGDDGKTLKNIEYPGGFSDGAILSGDEIELIFRDEASPSTICIDSLRRLTAAPVAATPALLTMPDMIGHWNGTTAGSIEQSGYQLTSGTVSMDITEQDGRFFSGTVSFVLNNAPVKKEFAGIFARDGKSFRTIENPDGFSNGIVISPNEVQLVFRDNNDPSRISIDTFVRSGAAPTTSGTAAIRLTGTWPGTSLGYMETGPGYGIIRGDLVMNITTQEDRLIAGQVAYVVNGTPFTKQFAGVIGRDGRTVETVEFPEGFGDGIVVSEREIQLVFRDDGTPSTISLDTFRRVE